MKNLKYYLKALQEEKYINQYRCGSIESLPVLIIFGVLLGRIAVDCGCGGNRVKYGFGIDFCGRGGREIFGADTIGRDVDEALSREKSVAVGYDDMETVDACDGFGWTRRIDGIVLTKSGARCTDCWDCGNNCRNVCAEVFDRAEDGLQPRRMCS